MDELNIQQLVEQIQRVWCSDAGGGDGQRRLEGISDDGCAVQEVERGVGQRRQLAVSAARTVAGTPACSSRSR